MTPVSQQSILIVEDEPIVAMDLQQTLEEFGYAVTGIASSTEEAIDAASAKCPDLVLMDIRIRGARDGITTAELLRSQFDVPVVYLTAHADAATVERAKVTEPQGYLLKPVKAADLRTVVELALYRHAMEKRLRARERWFSTTLRSIADAVVTVDLAGRVTFMNRAAEALTGSSAEQALGKPARQVLMLGSDASESDETPLGHALRAGHPVQLHEASLRNASTGVERLISDSAAPVVDETETLGAVMVFRDVTDQRRLQRQLEVADRLSSLGTMAAGVAHEVNNPLAVIVANVAYVRDELASIRAVLQRLGAPAEMLLRRLDEVSTASSEIDLAATTIAAIVADLKTFSRPAPARGEADVARTVGWALRTANHEVRYRAQVVTDLEAVPPVALDETRLGQVLINLLVNAAHAIEPGHVADNTIAVSVRRAGEHQVIIEVRDTGEGIAPETLPRIFEPFFTTKPVGQGTGLGLSICHGIVVAAGGVFDVESAVGRGTTFRVSLPIAAPKPRPSDVPSAPAGAARRGRVLVVDDEPLVLAAMARVLRDHDVVCVPGAPEALDALRSGAPFDVIFSDLMMPAVSGVDFYQELLRSRPDDARRVVFLTGGAITERSADFLASVPNLRIEKPFATSDIRNTVQAFIERSGAAK